jgi:hypothetical protein
MAWARLDDNWHEHPKTIEAGLEAAGLWVMCLTWANKHRRQTGPIGVVPVSVVDRLGGRRARALARKLVQVGYFDDLTDAGWPIHDFADYLPKYDPAKAAENGSKGGKAKRNGSKPLGEPPPEPPSGLPAEPPSEPYDEPLTDSPSKPEATRVGAPVSARRNTHLTQTHNQNPHGQLGSYVATVDADERAPEPDETPHDHSDAGWLAAYFAERQPLTDHARALRVIADTLAAGRSADEIRHGLDQLAAEDRGCTIDQLRVAMTKAPGNWRPSAAPGNPYLDLIRTGAFDNVIELPRTEAGAS